MGKCWYCGTFVPFEGPIVYHQDLQDCVLQLKGENKELKRSLKELKAQILRITGKE